MIALQAPLSMEFSRQEYWSGLPFPSSRDLADPGTESRSPELQADSLPSEPPCIYIMYNVHIYAKECSNYRSIALISHTSKVMLKILQARLQQYVNHELPNIQAGFRKGRGIIDQIANICWIIDKAREFQKNIYLCFIDYVKTFDCVDHHKLENFLRDGNIRPSDLPLEKPIFRSGSNSWNWTWNNRLVPNRKRGTSRLYIVTLFI